MSYLIAFIILVMKDYYKCEHNDVKLSLWKEGHKTEIIAEQINKSKKLQRINKLSEIQLLLNFMT